MSTTAHEDQFTPEPDLESEFRKARAKAQDVCMWTKRHTGDFKTQCGKDYICDYNCMCPKEDSFDFCLFCGKKIEVAT